RERCDGPLRCGAGDRCQRRGEPRGRVRSELVDPRHADHTRLCQQAGDRAETRHGHRLFRRDEPPFRPRELPPALRRRTQQPAHHHRRTQTHLTMENPKLIISEKERDLMRSWIIGHNAPDIQVRNSLDRLYKELDSADVRKEEDMPADVVRVCSTVDVETPAGRRNGLQIVMHADADLAQNKLSVLSVLGSALIGYRQGASIVWRLPQGDQTITLEKVDNARCDVELLKG